MNTKILYAIIALLSLALIFVIFSKPQAPAPQSAIEAAPTSAIEGNDYLRVTLTSAESKRLIAKGLMAYPPIVEALSSGEIVVGKGSTNHYLYEELMGKEIQKGAFLSGNIQPTGKNHKPQLEQSFGELYLKNGVDQNLGLSDALQKISKGALLFKGANMINYTSGQAAVLIGHPTGGTAGAMNPHVASGVAELIIPVGLEKNSSYDLEELAAKFAEKRQGMVQIFTLPGKLFTEIEALEQFAAVEVIQIASGGINGAEGAVSLSVRGTAAQIAKIKELLSTIYGETSFY